MSKKHLAFCAVISSLFLCLLVPASLSKYYGYDEHQFIASGAVLAKFGLWPYLNYPYFHVPNLIFINALLFRLSDHLLLIARLFQDFCAAALCLGLCLYVFAVTKKEKVGIQVFLALAACLFWISSPLFIHTSGLAWNRDAPLLALFASFLFFHFAFSTANPDKFIFLSGLFCAIAAGLRITYVLTAIPFLYFLSFEQTTIDKRWTHVKSFAGGLVLGSAPSLVFLLIAPAQFFFGNFYFNAVLGPQFMKINFQPTTMSLMGKTRFFFSDIFLERPTLILFGLYLVILAGFFIRRRRLPFEIKLPSAVALSLFAGGFCPTPSFKQYFFEPVIFIALAVATSVIYKNARKTWMAAVGLGLAFCIASAVPFYREVFLRPWDPVKSHQMGLKINSLLGCDKKVMTIYPLFVLEGGCSIYEQTVTGPFAFRVGELFSGRSKEKYKILDATNMEDYFKRDPPGAFLLCANTLCRNSPFEVPLLRYVESHHYKSVPMDFNMALWIGPRSGHP